MKPRVGRFAPSGERVETSFPCGMCAPFLGSSNLVGRVCRCAPGRRRDNFDRCALSGWTIARRRIGTHECRRCAPGHRRATSPLRGPDGRPPSQCHRRQRHHGLDRPRRRDAVAPGLSLCAAGSLWAAQGTLGAVADERRADKLSVASATSEPRRKVSRICRGRRGMGPGKRHRAVALALGQTIRASYPSLMVYRRTRLWPSPRR